MNMFFRIFVVAPLVTASAATAQTVFTEDVSIKGVGIEDQLCIGDNCADDEVYSNNFIKLRLKDEDIALEFDDRSADDRSWIIETNPSGIDRFQIGDQETGNKPFGITGNAPDDSIYIANTGDVGFGTSLPAANLHIVSQFNPEIRFEQTNGLAYSWDMFANSSNFVLRDRGGSAVTAPIIVRSGAPDSSFFIANNGAVGLGTSNPQTPLHLVFDNAGAPTDLFRLENNGGVVFRLKDTSAGGQEFTFQSNGGVFRIASPAVPGPELTMDDFGNVTITGEITTAGSCNSGCDRVFDADYDLPDMSTHHAAMWELGHLPNVGPTAEDGPMNLSEKVGGMLNELEHAHIFIDQLRKENAEQAQLIATMQARLDKLEQQN